MTIDHTPDFPADPFDSEDQGPRTPPSLGPFEPTPRQKAAILRAMSDVRQTLHSIAVEHNIALPALVLWLSTAPIQGELRAFELAAAQHARLCAMMQTPHALSALHEIIRGGTYEETHQPVDASTSRPRDRRRSTTLRAVTLVHKFAILAPPRAAAFPADFPAISSAPSNSTEASDHTPPQGLNALPPSTTPPADPSQLEADFFGKPYERCDGTHTRGASVEASFSDSTSQV